MVIFSKSLKTKKNYAMSKEAISGDYNCGGRPAKQTGLI